ncbi:sulfotransferase family protein [Thiocapsa bogorovii]|uniref:sulfotransferase family protein n=1 Tax=Thiocapsa bogorovii TaxID=521689 RepID=UPI001E6277BC|nr:sulfotransferase [Thiocapsa bogorovii]UHD17121.1 sulfotransferase [Thiocapsa bogorovii]
MRIAFLMGTGRCGSTVVHEVLARHPAFGFLSNIEDNLGGLNRLGCWNNLLYRAPIAIPTRKGGVRFAPSEGYRIIGREVSPIYVNSCRDLVAEDVTPWMRDRFQRFFSERAVAQRRELFLHKYTGWPRLLFFNEIFPDARFIHIVRDGRAVANSWLQMPWWNGYLGPESWLWGPLSATYRSEWEREGRSFVALAGIAWKLLMDAARAAEPALPADRYLILRFEDFTSDPCASFQLVLDFLDLPMTPQFLKIVEGYRFSSSRHSAYRRDLSQQQVTILERILDSHLARYGYGE